MLFFHPDWSRWCKTRAHTVPSRRVRGSDFDRMRGEMSIIAKDLYANEYSQKLVTGSSDENLDAPILLLFPSVIIDLVAIIVSFSGKMIVAAEKRQKKLPVSLPPYSESSNWPRIIIILKRFSFATVRWKLCGCPIKPSLSSFPQIIFNFQFYVKWCIFQIRSIFQNEIIPRGSQFLHEINEWIEFRQGEHISKKMCKFLCKRK